MLKTKKDMDPFFPHPDLKFEGFNSDAVLSKARTIVKEYKNNPAYLEFWPLVEVLDLSLAKYTEQSTADRLSELNDVLFEIHLIELYQTADKRYNLLKETVQQAIENGGPDVALYKRHYDKFIRIEQEYV
jgi:hypothetical protein